jgi:hypothetical protein
MVEEVGRIWLFGAAEVSRRVCTGNGPILPKMDERSPLMMSLNHWKIILLQLINTDGVVLLQQL